MAELTMTYSTMEASDKITTENLYLPSGYINMGAVMNSPYNFIFMLGPRGTGKTYGAIDYCIENNFPFVLLRRTQTQTDIISKEQFSPVKVNAENRGFHFKRSNLCKQVSANYYTDADGEIIDSQPFFYTAALNTFSNLRGFSLADALWEVYDEFAGEPNERPIKNEFMAFNNCYETINRNRELDGKPPLKFIGLANSFNLANPIFVGLQIVNDIFEMIGRGDQIYTDDERSLMVILPKHSPISERKAETALYRLNGKNEFSEMALENKFVYDFPENIGKRPLAEYKRLVRIGEITVCKHKSKNEYYVTTDKRAGTASSTYDTSDNDIMRANLSYGYLFVRHMQQRVYFENYVSQVLFEKFFCKKG